MLSRNARDDGVQLSFCLLDCDSRLEPADRLQEHRATILKRARIHSCSQRQPQIRAVGELEVCGHHSDYSDWLLSKHDRLSYDSRIGIESLAPQVIAQD